MKTQDIINYDEHLQIEADAQGITKAEAWEQEVDAAKKLLAMDGPSLEKLQAAAKRCEGREPPAWDDEPINAWAASYEREYGHSPLIIGREYTYLREPFTLIRANEEDDEVTVRSGGLEVTTCDKHELRWIND